LQPHLLLTVNTLFQITVQCEKLQLIVGGERTKDAKELVYARQKLVLVAKAFQLQAIDLVHIDYKGLSDIIYIDLHVIQCGSEVLAAGVRFLSCC